MDKEQALILAKRYKDLLKGQLPIEQMYLYGSYSKGTFNEESDIDIAVIVDHVHPDYFTDTPLLWKLRRRISNLIEPILMTEDQNNPLYQEIKATGIRI